MDLCEPRKFKNESFLINLNSIKCQYWICFIFPCQVMKSEIRCTADCHWIFFYFRLDIGLLYFKCLGSLRLFIEQRECVHCLRPKGRSRGSCSNFGAVSTLPTRIQLDISYQKLLLFFHLALYGDRFHWAARLNVGGGKSYIAAKSEPNFLFFGF